MKCPICDFPAPSRDAAIGHLACHPILDLARALYDATNIDAPEPVSGHAPNGLRDQFAVNAPPAPGWFMPSMKNAKPRSLQQYDRKAEENRQRLIQWPYAWAQMQLQERAGTVSATVKEDENA